MPGFLNTNKVGGEYADEMPPGPNIFIDNASTAQYKWQQQAEWKRKRTPLSPETQSYISQATGGQFNPKTIGEAEEIAAALKAFAPPPKTYGEELDPEGNTVWGERQVGDVIKRPPPKSLINTIDPQTGLKVRGEDVPNAIIEAPEPFETIQGLTGPVQRSRWSGKTIPGEKTTNNPPSGLEDFELTIYGKLVPELRGTPKYLQARLDFTRKMNEAKPFYSFQVTDQGIIPTNTKTGTQGGPSIGTKPLTNEAVVAEQQIGTMLETLERVKATYKDAYVGPAGGRYGGFKEKWIGLPKDQASFYADTAQIQNALIYLMSGKQINEGEYERLKKQIPDVNLPPSVFKSRMTVFKKTLDSIIAERHKNMPKFSGQQPTQKGPGKKQIGTKGGKPVYDNGDGTWTIGD